MSRRLRSRLYIYTPKVPELAILNLFNTTMRELLIATNNLGKLKEFRDIIGRSEMNLLSLDEVGVDAEIAESGATFSENAAIKASGYARLAGMPAVADDSGLEIIHLGGRPGVHSA